MVLQCSPYSVAVAVLSKVETLPRARNVFVHNNSEIVVCQSEITNRVFTLQSQMSPRVESTHWSDLVKSYVKYGGLGRLGSGRTETIKRLQLFISPEENN